MDNNIITIDGLIGAGKSTLMVQLWDMFNIEIKVEPIENWKPFLERIYKYNDSFYEFQIQIWKDVCCFENPFEKDIILERSPFFIRNTFLKTLFENDKITTEQYEHILNLHDQTDNKWKPKIMLYLRVSPETALSRIKKRNRENENYIDIQYLYKLYELHEQCYLKALDNGYNIHIIDAEKDLEEIIKDVLKIIK